MYCQYLVPVPDILFTFESNIAFDVPRALTEIQYLPPITFFLQLVRFDTVIIEKHEHYVKQTYRNRCCIRSAQGTDRLVIPVQSHGKMLMPEIRIDYRQKWLNRHWRAIQSAYGRAPYFEFYSPALREVLFSNYEFLYPLNMALLSLCLKWLRLEISIAESDRYEKEPQKAVIDLRNTVNPQKSAEWTEFNFPLTYTQVFGRKFVPDLSVIDLVFCVGPEAGLMVRSAAQGLLNK